MKPNDNSLLWQNNDYVSAKVNAKPIKEAKTIATNAKLNIYKYFVSQMRF
jgi:hypothetical protein